MGGATSLFSRLFVVARKRNEKMGKLQKDLHLAT